MKFSIIVLVLIFFNVISSARADLLVEPLVGYNFAQMKYKSTSDNESFSGSGVGYGGRLGFQQLGFQLGLDYLKSSIHINDDAFDSNVDSSEWAAFVGYEFPFFFRIYAGYIFSATGEYKDETKNKVELSEGSGSKLGIGFTGLPLVAINLEYRSGKFDKFEVAGSEGNTDVKYNSILLSVSVPLTF